jgi:hypothetical protein
VPISFSVVRATSANSSRSTLASTARSAGEVQKFDHVLA